MWPTLVQSMANFSGKKNLLAELGLPLLVSIQAAKKYAGNARVSWKEKKTLLALRGPPRRDGYTGDISLTWRDAWWMQPSSNRGIHCRTTQKKKRKRKHLVHYPSEKVFYWKAIKTIKCILTKGTEVNSMWMGRCHEVRSINTSTT